MQYLHPIAWAIAEDREREIRKRLRHQAWRRGRDETATPRQPRRLGGWSTWAIAFLWRGRRRAPGARV